MLSLGDNLGGAKYAPRSQWRSADGSVKRGLTWFCRYRISDSIIIWLNPSSSILCSAYISTESLCGIKTPNSQYEASTSPWTQAVNFVALVHKSIFLLEKRTQPYSTQAPMTSSLGEKQAHANEIKHFDSGCVCKLFYANGKFWRDVYLIKTGKVAKCRIF